MPPRQGIVTRKGFVQQAVLPEPEGSLTNVFYLAKGRKYGAWISENFLFTASPITDRLTTGSNHNWENGAMVRVSTTGTLPTGLAAATTYFVVQKNSGTFKLSATRGGSAIDITGAGTGFHTVTRYTGYTTTDFIEQPVYVIESILRDELGLTSARINTASFDELGNSTDGRRNGWKHARSITERISPFSLIGEIAEESALFFLYDHVNKARVVAIDHYAPTTVIGKSHIAVENNRPVIRTRKTHVRHIQNRFRINYRFNHGNGGFDKELFVNESDNNLSDNTRNDKSPVNTYEGLCSHSQTMYNYVREWVFESSGIRDEATAELFIKTMADWLAIRKWEVHATLLYGATTLAIEHGDQVLFDADVDILPISARNTLVDNVAAVPGSAGVLDDDTYYYVVTAVDKYGETKLSAEVNATTTAGAGMGSVAISWDELEGANKYRVYGRTTGSQSLYKETASTSLVDDGSAWTAGTPPTVAPAFFVTRIRDGGPRNGGKLVVEFVLCPVVFF